MINGKDMFKKRVMLTLRLLLLLLLILLHKVELKGYQVVLKTLSV